MLLKAFIIAVFAIICYFSGRFVYWMGFHHQFYQHHPGLCKPVSGATGGSEDIHLLSDGKVFITSGVWYHGASSGFKEYIRANSIKGRILLFDFNKPDAGAKEVVIKPSKDFDLDAFSPAGLSVLEDKSKGEHILFVVSHCKLRPEKVEKFKYNPKTGELQHVKSYLHDHFSMLNDVAATGEESFYVGNFIYSDSPLKASVEIFLGLKLGSIFYYNGTGYSEALSGAHGPNGMVTSQDGKYLYVVMGFAGALNVYEINDDKALKQLQSIPIQGVIDNLILSQDGQRLFVAGSGLTHKVMAHLEDPTKRAPSRVLSIPLKNGLIEENKIIELFYDQGELITASSAAAVYKNKLLVGSIMDKAVLCNVDVPY